MTAERAEEVMHCGAFLAEAFGREVAVSAEGDWTLLFTVEGEDSCRMILADFVEEGVEGDWL